MGRNGAETPHLRFPLAWRSGLLRLQRLEGAMDVLTDVRVNRSLSGWAVVIEGGRGAGTPKQLRHAGATVPVQAQRRMATAVAVPPRLQISPEVAGALHLPQAKRLLLQTSQTDWRLGPTLALYAPKFANAARPYGEQTHMFKELTTYGSEMGVRVLVIGPGFADGKIAYEWRSDRKAWVSWKNVTPDLVIRRSGTFRPRERAALSKDLRWFTDRALLHTLPIRCSNKWLLYKTLAARPSLRKYLPYAKFATTADQVYRAVVLRRDVYVKPLTGAQGVSIFHVYMSGDQIVVNWEERIVPRRSDRESTDFRPETRLQRRILEGSAAFVRFWQQTGLRQCLVQDTVELPKWRDVHPFDFRWLVQSSGVPQIIARIARLGKAGAVTTNIHTGGQACAAEQALSGMTAARRSQLLSELDNVALQVAQTLAREFGPFAELGIDLAVDPAGSVYLFEVNPTPGRRMLRAVDGKLRELSLRNLIEYAIKATGY